MQNETKFVVDLAISLTIEELQNFRKLATLLNKTVPDTVRECMNTRCKDQLVVLDIPAPKAEEVKVEVEPDAPANS